MQKTGSQCLGPVKALLHFGVGAFASVLDQSGTKKGWGPAVGVIGT